MTQSVGGSGEALVVLKGCRHPRAEHRHALAAVRARVLEIFSPGVELAAGDDFPGETLPRTEIHFRKAPVDIQPKSPLGG